MTAAVGKLEEFKSSSDSIVAYVEWVMLFFHAVGQCGRGQMSKCFLECNREKD